MAAGKLDTPRGQAPQPHPPVVDARDGEKASRSSIGP